MVAGTPFISIFYELGPGSSDCSSSVNLGRQMVEDLQFGIPPFILKWCKRFPTSCLRHFLISFGQF